AVLLDAGSGGTEHQQALQAQLRKIRDPGLTPSGTLLRDLRESGKSLHQFTLQQSRAHRDALLATPLDPAIEQGFEHAAEQSLAQQAQLEQNDTESFDDYVARYHAGLFRPAAAA